MKDIVILTVENDPSTDDIIDWLKNINEDVKICRINDSTLKNVENISALLKKDNCIIWSRKYRHLLQSSGSLKNDYKSSEELKEGFEKNAQNESKIILEYLIKSKNNTLIGNREPYAENKPYQLEIANKFEIDIPKTLITSSKNELLNFFDENNKMLICKPLSNAIMFTYKNEGFCTYTAKIDIDVINKLPDYFFPTLFQQQIEKEFEIRTFYFYGECWSIAIFSQHSEQTSVDFRQYDFNNPNRKTPYTLPEYLLNKVQLFMKSMNLETGSLDFIQATDGKIYFLEVNPEGQFGMVSSPCNYPIEETIAKHIIDGKKQI